MLPIRTIVHPSDFSERSHHAFHLACALARDYSARLIVMHVVPPPTVVYGEGVIPSDPQIMFDEGQKKLNQLVAPNSPPEIERHLTEGDAATEIVRFAKETNADMIVMGTHGRTGLSRFLMGSVAEQVVRKSPCPVLTLTGPFPETIAPATLHAEAVQAAAVAAVA